MSTDSSIFYLYLLYLFIKKMIIMDKTKNNKKQRTG